MNKENNYQDSLELGVEKKTEKEKQNTLRNITLAGLILTVLAVGGAIWQIYEARQLVNSISTRYIGEFPTNLPHINKMISQAKEEIIIFQDVMGYGAFSNPSEFHKFITILLEKKHAKNPVKIKMVIYEPKLYEETREYHFLGSQYVQLKQFNPLAAEQLRDSIFDIQKTSKFKSNYKKFKKHDFTAKGTHKILDTLNRIIESLPPKCDTLTYIQFYNTLVKIGNYLEAYCISNGFEIERASMPHVMNCWMVDNEKAIFGFPYNHDTDEIAFTTSDKHLMLYISDMHKYVMKNKRAEK